MLLHYMLTLSPSTTMMVIWFVVAAHLGFKPSSSSWKLLFHRPVLLVAVGAGPLPRRSSQSGGWLPLPLRYPRESTHGTGRGRASTRRSGRSYCRQTPAVDPAHLAKRCS